MKTTHFPAVLCLVHLAGLGLLVQLGSGCTTTTIVTTTAGDSGVRPPAIDGAVSVDSDPEPAASPEDTEDGGDAGPMQADAAPAKDGGVPDAKPDAKPDATPDATPDVDAGPVLVGGRIVLTCPHSGFHQPPPIEVASIPIANLPLCSATTKTCWLAATTNQEVDACLAADTTPPVTIRGESVDCAACERAQGAYCLASACRSEFSDYGCCAQENGGAACEGLLQTVTTCASTTGNAAYSACISALIPRCFP